MHHYLWDRYAEVRHTDYHDCSVRAASPDIQKLTLSHRYGSFAFLSVRIFRERGKAARSEKIELTPAIENGDK